MPHFILEYSSNIRESVSWPEFFAELHAIACAHAPIRLEDLKSRAVAHDSFLVSDGTTRKAFVFLSLALLSGRDPQALKNLGGSIISYLEKCFARSRRELNCSITFEIREMNRELHFKAG